MDIKERLERVGLSSNEAKVYLYLVDHGLSKAGKIAKGAGIQRSSSYGAINSLVTKGLISYSNIGNVKHFQATGPDRLVEYIKEQEQLITEVLPELKKRHKANKVEGQVRMFKGTKGVKAVFKDILRTGKDNVVFGDDGLFSRNMPVFCKQFVREQNLNKMKTQVLTRKRGVSYSKGTTYRFVDKSVKSNVAVNIYGDKIAIIIWTDTPEAVIIENKDAAQSLKSYFDFMWSHSEK
ncbi:hypothetical protein KY334_00850 [Candidatus Woesearchaeota archaeon]|nr:hypothetical protein [Candidatus Woesearchaeota archaeon]